MTKTEFLDGLSELSTIADAVRYAMSNFERVDLCYAHGTDNALDEAHLLVLHALHLGDFGGHGVPLPAELYAAALTAAEKREVGALLWRRIDERRPAAQLTGRAWFAGLEFYVDERVLVPRSPFAELIESGFEPWIDSEKVERILDIGTGSGCIAIACAYAMPWAEVVAADIDDGAREVANANVEAHGLEEQVSVVASDAFDGITGEFDLIVTNPPYVPPSSIEALPQEFHCEPRLGLDGGPDGLDIVRRIVGNAARYLSPHGSLIVEVGEARPQAEAVFADLELLWLDEALERGGEGLFLISANALAARGS